MKFNLGDYVNEKDGRHVGQIEAYVSGMPKVLWPNGWRSILFDDDLELYERREVRKNAPT